MLVRETFSSGEDIRKDESESNNTVLARRERHKYANKETPGFTANFGRRSLMSRAHNTHNKSFDDGYNDENTG